MARRKKTEKRELSLIEIFPGVLENRFGRSEAQWRWRTWIGGLHGSGHPGISKDERSFASFQVNSRSSLKSVYCRIKTHLNEELLRPSSGP